MSQEPETILQKMLRDFAKETKNQERAEQKGKKLWQFVLNFRIEQLGHTKSSSSIKQQIVNDATKKALEWDTDDASLSSEQKIMNRLAAGKYAQAVSLAESSLIVKEKNREKVISEYYASLTNAKHTSNNDLIKKALDYYKQKKHLFKTKDEAAIEMAKRYGPIKASTYRRYLRGN